MVRRPHRKGQRRPYRAGVLLLAVVPAVGALLAVFGVFLALSAAVLVLDAVFLGGRWLAFSFVLLFGAGVVAAGAGSLWRLSRSGIWVDNIGLRVRRFGVGWNEWQWSAFSQCSLQPVDGRLAPALEVEGSVVVLSELSSESPLTWGGSGPAAICDGVNAAYANRPR